MLTALTAVLDSSMGVSPLTSTTVVTDPTVIMRLSARFTPSRISTCSRTTLAKPGSWRQWRFGVMCEVTNRHAHS